MAILLKACLNGNRTRAEHDRVPLTADELAADARAVAAAGAGAVHVHPRDDAGRETLAGPESDAAVAAIRRACPGLPFGLTTGAWIEPDVERRLAAVAGWTELPDFASVNVYEEGCDDVARLLLDRGIGVEAGLATVEDAQRLAASVWSERCLRVLVEVEDGDPAAAVRRAAAIAEELGRRGVAAPQLHHGIEAATWPVIEAAVAAGRDVRVGLEDTLVLPDGRLAGDNAALVRAAARTIG